MKILQKKNIITLIILTILTLVGVFAPFINIGLTNGLARLNIASSSNSLLVHFINVGQGDALAVNLPDGKTALIDTGLTTTNVDYTDYLTSKVVNNGIKKVINYLILSHADADHIGGTLRLLKNFDVKTIYLPPISGDTETFSDIENYIKNKSYDVKINASGTIIEGKDYKFEFFGPLSYNDTNESCPIIKLSCYNKSFLFTGDISAEKELELLPVFKNEFDCDVLKVAHHGSKDSSSIEFLQAASPSYAVISCGQNSYGHPAEDTINNLNAVGAKVFRTDKDENIMFKVDQDENITFFLKNYTIVALKIEIRYLILILDGFIIFYFVKDIVIEYKKNKVKN